MTMTRFPIGVGNNNVSGVGNDKHRRHSEHFIHCHSEALAEESLIKSS